MKRVLDVTVLVDEAYLTPEDPEFAATGEGLSAEYHVTQALRELGHTVRIVGAGSDVAGIVQPLTVNRPDVVFNLTEQFRNERTLDKNVAGLLELMDIPYTGSGATGLLLCRDKALCKRILGTCGVDVPGFFVLPPRRKASAPDDLRFPMVVKPLLEDGSDGICNASLVKSEEEMLERARVIHERFSQPAIAEEYVEGRELYVSLLGNQKVSALPVRELHFSGNGGPQLATFRAKWDTAYQQKWGITTSFAELEPAVEESLARACRRAYGALHMYDYGRIDVRLTKENRVVVLEANPNPNLARDDEVGMSAERDGIGYVKLIDRIVNLALHRYGRDA